MTITPPHVWRKSSYSLNGAQCVELADSGADVLMRDSKHPDEGHLTFRRSQLADLVADIKAGGFDHLA